MKKLMTLLIAGIIAFGVNQAVFAEGDKGSMKGSDHDHLMETKKGDMQDAMEDYIEENTTDGVFQLEDPVTGKIRNLSYEGLHEGIGMKGPHHYSCADFKDLDSGEMLDVDILVDVDPTTHEFSVAATMIHKVDGEKVGKEDKGSVKGSDHDHKGSGHEHKGSH